LQQAIEWQLKRGRVLQPMRQSAFTARDLTELDALLGLVGLSSPSTDESQDGTSAMDALGAESANLKLTPQRPDLVAIFATEVTNQIKALDTAIQIGNLSDAARIAHNMKGAAQYINVASIAEHAAKMEAACKSQDVSQLKTAYPALHRAIDTHVNEGKS
jgi:HPt (histidine-containing phosphotransfer) domain-containing protein